MQLQFSKMTLPYMRRVVWETKNEEYTQEVKLSESLPDIGRILGVWGQPLIRSKEWRGNSMSAAGGIMAWILYAPEEGQQQCVETWIPFQTQWDFPETQYDAVMRVSCQLKGMDARSVSARKIVLRGIINMAGEALEPAQGEWYHCETVPEDVQILRNCYPVCLPMEAGEKTITLDEELAADHTEGQIQKILHCTLQPEIVDQKVMADKVVYRGIARAEMLCRYADESVENCDFEIPFSQYAQLEKEYGVQAFTDVMPAVTNLEVDLQENGMIRLKAGLVGQHVIYDTTAMELISDAYSVQRTVDLQQQTLEMPAVLELRQETLRVESTAEGLPEEVKDMKLFLQHPILAKSGDICRLEIPGSLQLLGRGENGDLAGMNLKWEKSMELPADGDMTVLARAFQKGKIQKTGSNINADVTMDLLFSKKTGIRMVTGLEIGELKPRDDARPSLILRRAGKDSLWEIAKSCESTVEAIQECNGLSEEPQEDRVLLIPVC